MRSLDKGDMASAQGDAALSKEGVGRLMDQLERYFEANKADTSDRAQRLRALEHRQEETLRMIQSASTSQAGGSSRPRESLAPSSPGGPPGTRKMPEAAAAAAAGSADTAGVRELQEENQ